MGPEELLPVCRCGPIVTGRDVGASFCPKAAPAEGWGCCDVRAALLEDPGVGAREKPCTKHCHGEE